MSAALIFGVNLTIAANLYGFDASYEPRDGASSIRFVSSDHSICIRSDFRGGRLNGCVEIGANEFDLLIRPERKPINDSAWYAFRIESTKPATVRLRLHYQNGTHRYRPQVSRDRKSWRPMKDHLVSVSPQKTEAVIEIRVDEEPRWISAQELLTGEDVQSWSESLSELPFVRQQEIGRSVQNRPIHQLEIAEPGSSGHIFIMARQHPPEVSGTIGMMRFVESIASDSEIASKFRKEFATIVVPTSNPDGVASGHWRCNANGVDLNRDWGRFEQPETRAISRSVLERRTRGRDSLWLVLDFHSTYEDVFYTSADVDRAFPAGFTTSWFDAIGRRFPDYDVNHNASHNGNSTTSKSWVHRTLNVAAVTYEFGDNTNRARIRELAHGSAEEMMRCLLAFKHDNPGPKENITQSTEPEASTTRLIGVQPNP